MKKEKKEKEKKKIAETPLMKQFLEIKAQHPEALLLFRVGDFYETFGEDAIITSKVLGIVLTKRANGPGMFIELAGFPHHSIETYLPKLVKGGYKVAICEQLENPKLTKSIVKRGVTELITPGVAYNDQLLPQKENNFLASVYFYKDKAGIAFIDISTGSFKIAEGSLEYIGVLLSNFSPKEVLLQRGFEKGFREKYDSGVDTQQRIYISTIDEWAFVFESSYEKLRKQFKLESLKGFGVEDMPLAITAAGAILFYLDNNQQASSDFFPTRGLGHICSVSRIDETDFVWLDKFTVRNLEIFTPASGNGVSLLDIIDKCSSPMGGRLLRNWLAMPSKDLREIRNRHSIVGVLRDNEELMAEIGQRLEAMGDLERIISKAAAGRISPREVLQLRRGLDQVPPIKELVSQSDSKSKSPLNALVLRLDDCIALRQMLTEKLSEDPASQVGKGEVIAVGVDMELDELRNVARNGKDILLGIQRNEAERTGISSLKISFNNVFGYYLEVRNTYKDKVPPEWIRKQTLVSAERYITPELKEYEQKILGAEERIYAIESKIFEGIVFDVQKEIRTIQCNTALISRLDVLLSFALAAVEFNYCCPELNEGYELSIVQGRHPVIERLMNEGEEYVSNDLFLNNDRQQVIILTGPNMSGKSALLRQTALIALMAQVGSFVPAKSAKMGFVDKIFTRVGASDNISRGESTFMVEMLETATILHNLSSRSLLLLDEIGRGTSTFDGMSIAWAIVEYLHERGMGAKTLFATHYHELNDLEKKFNRVKNFHISVKEIEGKILFLRKMRKGGVAHSFGIHVARLAGMPQEVIENAERVLAKLESKSHKRVSKGGGLADGSVGGAGAIQLSLFQVEDPLLVKIRDTLKEVDLERMSPLDAFDLLRNLKRDMGVN